MNEKLYVDFGKRINAIINEKERIKEDYNNSSTEEKRVLKESTQNKINALNYEKNILSDARANVKSAWLAYKNAITEEEKFDAAMALSEANENMYVYATKFNIPYDRNDEIKINHFNETKRTNTNEEVEVKNVSENKKLEKKSRVVVPFILTGLLATGWVGHEVYHHNWFNKTQVVEQSQNDDDKTKDADSNKNYGMTTKFTDASNEKQLDSRVNDIYANYVDTPSAGYATTVELSQDRLANCIRICNGEFMQKDGEVTYNKENVIEAANTIATYANSTSYSVLGSNLEYKPLSVLFEEDTIAYKVVNQNDKLMLEIYNDIKANDVEKFRADSIKWGEFIRDTFIYNDINRDVISIFSVDDAQKYEVAACLLAPYESSIGEFSRSIAITNPNFAICVPYCVNGTTGANTDIELSKLVYSISDTKINALAERAGMKEEWDKNNDPILIQCLQFTQQYYNDKYDREIGYSKKLN